MRITIQWEELLINVLGRWVVRDCLSEERGTMMPSKLEKAFAFTSLCLRKFLVIGTFILSSELESTAK